MFISTLVVPGSARLAGLAVGVVVLLSVAAGRVDAQEGSGAAAAASVNTSADLSSIGKLMRDGSRAEQPIRRSLGELDYASAVAVQRPPVSQSQAPFSPRRRSITRRVIGGALGAVGGLFAGGFLGAVIEGDRCNCDDPGLQGALIGAPIGAISGAFLGAMFF